MIHIWSWNSTVIGNPEIQQSHEFYKTRPKSKYEVTDTWFASTGFLYIAYIVFVGNQ